MGVRVREKVKGSGTWWVFIKLPKQNRIQKSIGSKKAAMEAARKIEEEIALARFNIYSPLPKVVPTFREYAENWMRGHVAMNLKGSSEAGYRYCLDRHIIPEIGGKLLDGIGREDIKRLAYAKNESGLSPRTVTYIVRTISAIYGHAVEDGIVSTNPATRPGKFIKTTCRRDKIGFLTPEEGVVFLTTSREHYSRWHPLFFTAFHTGMRQGELIGLQWGDIDWRGNFLEVRRSLWEGITVTPKSGKSRRVDMSNALSAVLIAHRKAIAEESIGKGRTVPEWVFPSTEGTPLDPANIRKVFVAVLRKAGLRQIRFHDTRHCFASWLIGNGESLAYVKDQLGHRSIQITVDTYGHLVPGSNREAVNRLAGILGPRVDPATKKG